MAMNYDKGVKKPRTTTKPTTMKPGKPKGAGAAKTVKGKAALPKANKRGY